MYAFSLVPETLLQESRLYHNICLPRNCHIMLCHWVSASYVDLCEVKHIDITTEIDLKSVFLLCCPKYSHTVQIGLIRYLY